MSINTVTDIELWRTINIAGAALGQTLFVALYMTFPWWRAFLGRALFFKAVAFALLVDVAVAGRIWDWPNEDATFVVLYGIVGVGIWCQLFAFAKVKWDAHINDPVSGNRVNLRD